MRRFLLAAASVAAVCVAAAGFSAHMSDVAGATTPTPTPTATPVLPTSGITIAIDCDTSAAGIQNDCTRFTGAQSYEVAVVAVNTGPAHTLDGIDLEIAASDVTKLTPVVGPNAGIDSNPDLAFAGTWARAIASIDLIPAFTPGTVNSTLSCDNGAMPLADSLSLAQRLWRSSDTRSPRLPPETSRSP